MRQLTLIAIPDCPLTAAACVTRSPPTACWTGGSSPPAPGTAKLWPRNAPALLPAPFNESGMLLAHGRLSERGLRKALAIGADVT